MLTNTDLAGVQEDLKFFQILLDWNDCGRRIVVPHKEGVVLRTMIDYQGSESWDTPGPVLTTKVCPAPEVWRALPDA